MLTSISPLGERARGNRWAVTAAFYMAASVLAAVGVGAALGAAGGALFGGRGAVVGLPGWSRAAAFAVLAGAAVAADCRLLPLPTVRRQVDEDWLNRYRGWAYGVGFGAQLGLGVATIVTTATVYLTLAGEVLVAGPALGAVVGATFGAVRAAPLMVTGRARDHRRLVARHRQLVALAPAGAAATVTVTAAAGALLATTAILTTGRVT